MPRPQHECPRAWALKECPRTPCKAGPSSGLFYVFTDIDECEQPEACHGGQCTNTEGSYHCKCDKGYIMVRKGHCQGKEWGATLPSPGPSQTLVAPNSPSSLSLAGPLHAEPSPKTRALSRNSRALSTP